MGADEVIYRAGVGKGMMDESPTNPWPELDVTVGYPWMHPLPVSIDGWKLEEEEEEEEGET